MKFTRTLASILLSLVLFVSAFPLSASAAGTTMYGIGFVNTQSLRLRSQPSTTSSVLDTASVDECVVIVSRSGDWYHVIYNLQEGYMHQDYLDAATCENAELGYGKITGTSVNLRSGPSTSNKVVTVARNADKCYIIGLNNGWYKVIYNNTICYVRSDYLELTEFPYENRKAPNSPKFFRRGKSTGTAPSAAALNGASSASAPTTGASGSQILAEARKYLGTPYVYGGASPSGFDCSGFVYYVLKQVGYSPYRTPASQYQQGSSVAKEDLQVGDLVFFSSNSTTITHVGIYSGNGQFIHAPNSRSTVSYSDLTSGYWANTYYGARRMG